MPTLFEFYRRRQDHEVRYDVYIALIQHRRVSFGEFSEALSVRQSVDFPHTARETFL